MKYFNQSKNSEETPIYPKEKFRLMSCSIYNTRTTTAKTRNRVRKVVPMKSHPKAIPLFSVKKSMAHSPIIFIDECNGMDVFIKNFISWSQNKIRITTLTAIILLFRC